MSTLNTTRHWDRLHRKDVRSLQFQLLRKQLERLRNYSPYYREKLKGHGELQRLEDIAEFPFTSKADLLPDDEHPKRARDFILQPDPEALRKQPSVIFKALLRGREAVKRELEHEYRPIFLTSTTGRSAEPTPFFYTGHDLEMLREGGRRLIEIGTHEPDDRVLNLFPYAPHLAYWLCHYAALESGLFCLSTGGGRVMNTRKSLAMIKKIAPSILTGMPTFIYHVLHEALERGQQVRGLKRLVLGGEKVPDGTRRKLSRMCEELGSPGVRVMATYGFTEAKMAYVECPFEAGEESCGYHLYPDFGLVEVVDPESGLPVGEGQGGEIVYTPLQTRGTSVLRYRTGDYIEHGLTYEPCPRCGRTLPRLLGRISRVSDIRPMQLRKLKGTLVDFNQLEHVLDDIEGVGTWQVELRKKNDDPLELDELILHLSTINGAREEFIEYAVTHKMESVTELRPNRIEFHDSASMRNRQKVGKAMKEEKIIDNRATEVRLDQQEAKEAS